MSTSTDSIKTDKSRKGKARRDPSTEAAAADARAGGDRRSSAAEPASEGKQRSWAEQHGGSLLIGAAFALIALLVVVKNACS